MGEVLYSLCAEYTTLFERVEINLRGNNQQELLIAKLSNIKLMLSSAMDQLKEMGGFGVVDKEVENKLKHGLEGMRLLVSKTWELHAVGIEKGCCDLLNSLLMFLSGTGCNPNKNYLNKLAKEIIETLPSFVDPVNQGRRFVKDADMIMLERLGAKLDIARSLLLLSDGSAYSGCVSVVPVLGMAGSGKTTLARLVYMDRAVQEHFDSKHWVDISGLYTSSDILQKVAKIFNLGFDMPDLKAKNIMQTVFKDRKFLLVLEGLFDVHDGDWSKLLHPLLSAVSCYCKHGSKILVNSRSKSLDPRVIHQLPVAAGAPYVLEQHHPNECQELFQRIAFRGIARQERDPQLLDISDQICNKCANNLHAITIIASILSSQPTDLARWQYFNDTLLTSLENPIELIQSLVDLMQIISQLERRLLTMLFLFPVDYRFTKADLLQPIRELGGGHSNPERTDKVFAEYFDKLLSIGYFFEDSKTNRSGREIVYYKAQVLLFEVARHLVKDEWYVLDKFTKEVQAANMVLHVSFMVDSSWEVPGWIHGAKLLKSLFFIPTKSCKFVNISNINEILVQLKSLEALDLVMVENRSSLDSIGELKKLKYLRLGISCESLPESITNLEKLTTLDLRHTAILRLPTNFNRLTKLRFLYTGRRMIDLPPGFGKMTSLVTLDEFIVGENNGLYELAELTLLAGTLNICYQEGREKHRSPRDRNFLADRNLEDMSLTWSPLKGNRVEDTHQERDALESEFLQPPSTLKSLTIKSWNGVKFPRWEMDQFATLLKSLLTLQIVDCNICQRLPPFNSLPNLESLQLQGLPALEWVEIPNEDSKIVSSSSLSKTTYFPSLKYLMLANLPQLKGWSKVDNHQFVHQQETFECLSELKVSHCPMMTSMPLVPSLEKLEVVKVHVTLLKHLLHAQETPASTQSTSSTLKQLHINSVSQLESLTITTASLQVLAIRECKDLAHVFVDPTNTLKRLQIQACPGIIHTSQIMHNLTLLEELEIHSCQESDWLTDEDSARVALQGLKSLRSITLINISKPEPFLNGLEYMNTLKELCLCWLYNLTILPESIGHLSGLTRLVLRNCPKVKRIPEYFPNLKSLKRLEIKECTKLQKRCEQPNGEDCHLIQHILPGVYLGELPTLEGY